MRAGHCIRSWRTRTAALAAAVGLCGAVMSAGATRAGAAPAPRFGAPTGYGCAGVGLSQGPSSTFDSLGLPVDAWNGVPVLGLLEDPAKVGGQPLLGPSCGDFAHGSYEIGAAGAGRTSFRTEADGAVESTASVHTNASSPSLALLGQSVAVYSQSDQDAYVTPLLGPGDRSFTISVTYTIVSSSTTGPAAGASSVSNWAGTSLSYASSAASPSCGGQAIPGVQTGDFLASEPGTYTAQTEFSCPPGETLSDAETLGVTFDVVQSGWFRARPEGADYAGSIVAAPDSVTVSLGS